MKEETLIGKPVIGEPRGGWSSKGGGRTASPCGQTPPLFLKVVVVEVKERVEEEKREKEGGDGRSVTHFGQVAKLLPPLSPTFHHPPHLDSLMLKPLTKSIKSQTISFHLFPKFFLFLFEIFGFYHMQ
jgi:hypothetical protein